MSLKCGVMVALGILVPSVSVRIAAFQQIAEVALMVEHLTCNQGVAGSTPVLGSKFESWWVTNKSIEI